VSATPKRAGYGGAARGAARSERRPHRAYRWEVIQEGRLPLRPDGRWVRGIPHLCTSIVAWPAGETPGRNNSVITDPCFAPESIPETLARLACLGISFNDLGHLFETHRHGDHLMNLREELVPRLRPWPGRWPSGAPLGAMRVVACPGHSADLRSLAFTDVEGREVWIVGDAVLDEEWLRAWRCYWPNGYAPEEIRQTWHSLGRILSRADLIIPGHGPPLAVTPQLIADLAATFPHADEARVCPSVLDLLQRRLDGKRTQDQTAPTQGPNATDWMRTAK
jgi:glyoxylase-like metal-dependent hydrolase (beta-lactamase superfamily II)